MGWSSDLTKRRFGTTGPMDSEAKGYKLGQANDDENIESLRASIAELNEKDRAFAESLISQWEAKGRSTRSLSEKQWYWVKTLAVRAQEGKTTGVAARHEELPGFDPILDWFDNAGKRVEWPSVRLETVRLKGRSGMRKVRVIDLETDSFLGTLEKDGSLVWRKQREMPARVISELNQLKENPLEYLGRLGRATGKCMCCGRDLTNDESVELGIGPVCRENFGW